MALVRLVVGVVGRAGGLLPRTEQNRIGEREREGILSSVNGGMATIRLDPVPWSRLSDRSITAPDGRAPVVGGHVDDAHQVHQKGHEEELLGLGWLGGLLVRWLDRKGWVG